MHLGMFVLGVESRLLRLLASGDLDMALSVVVKQPLEASGFLRWCCRPLASAESAESLLYLRKRSPGSTPKVRKEAGSALDPELGVLAED